MIAVRLDIGIEDVLLATRTFWQDLVELPPDERLRLPLTVGVDVPGCGSFSITVGAGISVSPGPIEGHAPVLEVGAEDWLDLLERATTVTDLFFAGRLKAVAFETWRGKYAQLFTLIRTTQGRPIL